MANNISVELLLETQKAVKSINNLTKSVDKFADESTAGFKSFENAVDKSTKNAAGQFNKLNGALGSFIGNLGSSVLLSGLSTLKNGLGDAFQGLLGFSSGIAEINSLLPKTAQLTEDVKDELFAISSEFGKGLNDQTKAYYDIVSAGIKGTANQVEVLRRANEAAVAGLVEVGTAADIITTAINNYASSGLTAQQASDALFAAVQDGKTTFDQLAASVGRVAPLAKSSGVSFQELTGTLGFLTKSGINTNESVTGLRGILSAVIKPSKEAADFANKLGIEFNISAIKAKGFAGFLKSVREATGGSVEQIGKLIPNLQGLGPAIAVLTGDFGEFKTSIDNANESMGKTATAADTMQESLDFQVRQLNVQLDNLSINLARKVAPNLLTATRALNQFLSPDKRAQQIKILQSELRELQSAIKGTSDTLIVAKDENEGGLEETFIGVSRRAGEATLTLEQARLKIEQIKTQLADIQGTAPSPAGVGTPEDEESVFEKQLQKDYDAGVKWREDYNKRIEETDKMSQNKLFDLTTKNQKKLLASDKLNKQQRLQAAKMFEQNNVQIIQAGANLATAIGKEGNKTLFLVQKAAAAAQTIVATNAAVVQALLIPPPAGEALAAQRKIIGGISLATILATTIKGYQDGGFVGGTSFSGDRQLIRANSGEFVANQSQQRNIVRAVANGESVGGNSEEMVEAINNLASRPIVVEVDGSEIAKVVRDARTDGLL